MRNDISKNKIHNILSYLYSFRMLTYKQILDFLFVSEGLTESYCDKVIKSLTNDGYIEKTGTRKVNFRYFVTKKSIKFLRENGIIAMTNIRQIVKDDVLPCHKIKMKEQNLNHQEMLNSFVLNFMEMSKGMNDINFSYYDELYLSSVFPNIRPDGILIVNNTYYLLELDMNTERKASLKSKWEHYRNFLNSSSYFNTPLNIKCLFILENVNEKSLRKQNLQSYISEYLGDKINSKFDIIIDTPLNLLGYIKKDVQNNDTLLLDNMKKFGFKVSGKNFTNDMFGGLSFDRYAHKIDSNGKILNENGIDMEYILDDFYYESMYVISKIEKLPMLSILFKQKTKRELKYIILVKSAEDIYRTLYRKDTNLLFDNLYFTTRERMIENHNLDKALFQIDSLNQIYHYENSVKVIEGTIYNNF